MWQMRCDQGRQMQTEKMSWMRRSGNHAETGREKIFRLRLRLFIKKIRLTQQAPAGITRQGLFYFSSTGVSPLSQTRHLLTPGPSRPQQMLLPWVHSFILFDSPNQPERSETEYRPQKPSLKRRRVNMSFGHIDMLIIIHESKEIAGRLTLLVCFTKRFLKLDIIIVRLKSATRL